MEVEGIKIFALCCCCWLVAPAASFLEAGSVCSTSLGAGLDPSPCVDVFKYPRLLSLG